MLEPSQTDLYQHAISTWRMTETRGGDGKPGAKTWNQVLTDLPCYCNLGKSQQGPNGGVLLTESDNLFTFDEFSMEAGTDIALGDIVKLTAGPTEEVGKYWTARGDPQTKSLMANKLSILCSRTPKKPAGVDP